MSIAILSHLSVYDRRRLQGLCKKEGIEVEQFVGRWRPNLAALTANGQTPVSGDAIDAKIAAICDAGGGDSLALEVAAVAAEIRGGKAA